MALSYRLQGRIRPPKIEATSNGRGHEERAVLRKDDCSKKVSSNSNLQPEPLNQKPLATRIRCENRPEFVMNTVAFAPELNLKTVSKRRGLSGSLPLVCC